MRGLLKSFFFVCVFAFGSVSYGSVISGLVLVEGNTPVHTDQLILQENTVVRLAFSQLQIGGGTVSGKALIAQGAQQFLVVDLNADENPEIALAPGTYNLLAYVDLDAEPVAEVVLAVDTAEGVSLYNQALTVSPRDGAVVDNNISVLQPFVLAVESDVEFSFTSFEQYDVSGYFADDVNPPAVMLSNSDGSVRIPILITETTEKSLFSLAPGNYFLSIVAQIPEQAVSGFFWTLNAGGQSFGDKVLLNGTDSESVMDVLEVGLTGNIPASEYQITSAGMLGAGIPGYGLVLEGEDGLHSLSAANDYSLTSELSGEYRILLIGNAQDNVGIGINVRETATAEVVFADVYALGDVGLIGQFELGASQSVSIATQDYRFVNAFASAEYAITDGGAVVVSTAVTEDGVFETGALAPGSYFMLGRLDAFSAGNSLIGVELLGESGAMLASQLLIAGDAIVSAQRFTIAGGQYDFTMSDMNFPQPAAEIALGLFGEDHRYIRYLPANQGGVERERLALDSGTYLLAFLIETGDDETALFGYQVDVVEEEPATDSNGNRSSNGSGGGGGGGSFGLVLMLLMALSYGSRSFKKPI